MARTKGERVKRGTGEHFVVEGFSGRHDLRGNIAVRGAKNAALKALAASILFKDEMRLSNVPAIEDVRSIISLLKKIGVLVKKERESSYVLAVPQKKIDTNLSPELAKRIRASIVLTGPLLARYGHVSFPHPGGCVIGVRPIDIFLDGFTRMGAEIQEHDGLFNVRAPFGGLRGAELLFKNPSVTATETLMMAAVLAQGISILKNAAREPEIEILARFLNDCGARISGAGSGTVEIEGCPLLLASGKSYTTPPDRIEAGSFLILGALAGEDVRIVNCNPSHLDALIDALRLGGVEIDVGPDSLRVGKKVHPRELVSCDIKTQEYPGFPTDLQAPMTVFLTQAKGTALVFETIFEGRLDYAQELVRMGADITSCDPHRIIVRGPTSLHGRELESPDLRAGLAFIIAAVIADGESVIHTVYNIDRGYEEIEKRLRGIGVDIKRIG